MEKVLEKILNLIPENATLKVIILGIFLALFLYSLSQGNAIYDFIDKFNKRELSQLRDLLADENISETAKKKLREKVHLIAYKRVTGINTNKYLQKKIINCYELAEGRLRYSDFKRAFYFNFLKIDDNDNLTIRKLEIIEWILIIAATVVFVGCLMAFLFLLYLLIFAPTSIKDKITILLLTIVSLFFSLIYSFPLSSIFAVNKIKNEIKKIKLKQDDSNNKQLRPYGLCEGEFTVPDDFDDALPEDILKTFEGK